jgi:Fe2+ transport system protein FeoA
MLIVYTMGIFDLKEGSSGRVARINVSGRERERLSCLGFEVGARVTVLGFSLFKSSVLIGVGQTRVAVRKEVACQIELTNITNAGNRGVTA